MTRAVAVAATSALALAVVVGVSALLARPPGRGAVEAARREPAAIQGDAARAGKLADTTLHRAHVRGSEAVACRECHDIEADGFTRPDRERCLGCHPARKAALHAAVADDDVADGKDPRECTRCHDFLDATPTADRAWQCKECHERPHAKPTAAGGERAPVMVMTGSNAEVCGRCHSPHGDEAAAPKACIGCHEGQGTGHALGDDPGTGACLGCHRQHDAKENALARCAECHQGGERGVPAVPASATFAGGHAACVACHPPHAFTRRTVKACASCHADRVALAASRVGAHRDCRNCHAQHDVTVSAPAACTRCHDKVSPQHPRSEGGHACLGCHPAHPGRETTRPAVACTSCHRKAADDRGLHEGAACSDCHQPHGFARAATSGFCLGCHAGRMGQAAPVLVNAGHGTCARCHGSDPHAPAKPPACATCHDEQGTTVPKGHATCTDCHDQHSGDLRARASTCAGCHPERKAGPHGAIKGGCASCHRPHAPGVAAPPACASCHDATRLPGMHAVMKHAACTECHQPHGPPPLDRETCLKCHKDRRDHEPAAGSCVGCHPFVGGRP